MRQLKVGYVNQEGLCSRRPKYIYDTVPSAFLETFQAGLDSKRVWSSWLPMLKCSHSASWIFHQSCGIESTSSPSRTPRHLTLSFCRLPQEKPIQLRDHGSKQEDPKRVSSTLSASCDEVRDHPLILYCESLSRDVWRML